MGFGLPCLEVAASLAGAVLLRFEEVPSCWGGSVVL